jgi:hypothetical protein
LGFFHSFTEPLFLDMASRFSTNRTLTVLDGYDVIWGIKAVGVRSWGFLGFELVFWWCEIQALIVRIGLAVFLDTCSPGSRLIGRFGSLYCLLSSQY